ncbi:hypothetical protein P3S67_016291 [Capsicum chacoense]
MKIYYIFASMENVLRHQYQSMTTIYDMLESLKEMFGEQNCVAKQTTMKALLTTKMVEGTSVREHVLKIISLLNKMEILSAVIDKESQMDLSFSKLLNELQTAKSIIKQQSPLAALMVDKPSSLTSKPKGEKKKKTRSLKVPGANDGVAKPKGK